MAVFIYLVPHHVLRRRSASADAGVGVFRDAWSKNCCQRFRTAIAHSSVYSPLCWSIPMLRPTTRDGSSISGSALGRVGNRGKEMDRGGYKDRVAGYRKHWATDVLLLASLLACEVCFWTFSEIWLPRSLQNGD